MSCLYSFVVYLYVNGSGSITSFGEERANLSAVVYLYRVSKKPMPLLIGIYVYISTSTGMHLTYTIQEINIF